MHYFDVLDPFGGKAPQPFLLHAKSRFKRLSTKEGTEHGSVPFLRCAGFLAGFAHVPDGASGAELGEAPVEFLFAAQFGAAVGPLEVTQRRGQHVALATVAVLGAGLVEEALDARGVGLEAILKLGEGDLFVRVAGALDFDLRQIVLSRFHLVALIVEGIAGLEELGAVERTSHQLLSALARHPEADRLEGFTITADISEQGLVLLFLGDAVAACAGAALEASVSLLLSHTSGEGGGDGSADEGEEVDHGIAF